jgi:hypothetical protein
MGVVGMQYQQLLVLSLDGTGGEEHDVAAKCCHQLIMNTFQRYHDS